MKEEKEINLTIKQLQKRHKGTLTDEVISKLEEAFKNDFTNEEASFYAGISPSTYYTYCQLSKEFVEKMERAKFFIAMAAKRNIAQSVSTKKNVDDSWKYLERRQKNIYSPRVENVNADADVNDLFNEDDGFNDKYNPEKLKEAQG